MNHIKLQSLGLQQMQREIETWLRFIDFLIAENIFLKNRLSEVIQNEVTGDTLEQIENFQNTFITKDTIFALLVKDIKEHGKTLDKEATTGKEISTKLLSVQNKLRDDIGKIEKEYTNLWMTFNKFLIGIFR